jgi:hypothetical protein
MDGTNQQLHGIDRKKMRTHKIGRRRWSRGGAMDDDGLEGKGRARRRPQGHVSLFSSHTLGPRGGARSFPVSVLPSSVSVISLADLLAQVTY